MVVESYASSGQGLYVYVGGFGQVFKGGGTHTHRFVGDGGDASDI
mgnify:FL=1